MSGKASRQKGDRLERLVVGIFAGAGIEARRMPLSGAVEGFPGDVQLILNGSVLKLECKSSASRFSNLYRWLEGNDGLAVKLDRNEPLIVMEARKLANLLSTIPGNRVAEAVHAPPANPSADPPLEESQPASIPFNPIDQRQGFLSVGKPSVHVGAVTAVGGDQRSLADIVETGRRAKLIQRDSD